MSGRLDGKVAIVSGASRGIGAEVARRFAAEGAGVLVTDVRSEGEAVARSIVDAGGRARYRSLDVRERSQWDAAVDEAESVFGPVDVLVSNAFISSAPALADVSVADWEASLHVNLSGAVNGIQAVLTGMRSRGSGTIVVISATQGNEIWVPANAAYQAAKAALTSTVRHVAIAYGRDGVRANAVHPGGIDTEMLAEEGQREGAEALAKAFPIARLGRPADIASAALYLASDESSYVTGSAVVVDGGAALGITNPA